MAKVIVTVTRSPEPRVQVDSDGQCEVRVYLVDRVGSMETTTDFSVDLPPQPVEHHCEAFPDFLGVRGILRDTPEPAQEAPTPARGWECEAVGEQEDPCEWPLCGCDPAAMKVLAVLQERGLLREGALAQEGVQVLHGGPEVVATMGDDGVTRLGTGVTSEALEGKDVRWCRATIIEDPSYGGPCTFPDCNCAPAEVP